MIDETDSSSSCISGLPGSIEFVGKEEWQKAVALFLDYNHRQIWEYGILCAHRKRARVEHIIFRSCGSIFAAADVRVKTIASLNSGIAYISGGPLSRQRLETQSGGTFKRCIELLVEEYVSRRGLSLRVQCPLGPDEWNSMADNTLRSLGFKSVHGLRRDRTILVDMNRSLDEILNSFSGNWRKNLRRAETRGLWIEEGTDLKMFESVLDLFYQLVERKKFKIDLGADFYKEVQEQASFSDRFVVILARYESEVAGMLVVSVLGDMITGILGATSHLGAQKGASYLMHWHAMKMAKSMGKRAYDLGGIDPNENPAVYNFKIGTRGQDVTAVGPLQLNPPGIRGLLVRAAERCYRVSAKVVAITSSKNLL